MTTLRFVPAAVAALLLASCGGDSQQPQNITGAGATFPYPIYSKWISEHNKANPMVRINYQSQGSGAGITQVIQGTVDFGASDQPMPDAKIEEFRTARKTNVLHFPTVLGAVVPTYNLPTVTQDLNFNSQALAGIFLGKITKWNDPAIASANPGVTLPNAEIVVVHRSDGSGTTFVWTDYLSKVSPEWAAGPGANSSVKWPVGLGGKGNEGVMGLVKQTENSIGYTEMIYAVQNKIPTGRVQNMAGKFVKASIDTITNAADGVEMPADFRVSITNAAGDDSFPIASFTWLLVPETIEDPGKREAVVDFLKWMLGPGQQLAPALDYAPLPASVVEKELALISRIK